MLDAVEDIETEAAKLGLTVMVSEFDVAGLPVAQVKLDVITQVTTSPFTRPDVV
jgi:hypothetical protein